METKRVDKSESDIHLQNPKIALLFRNNIFYNERILKGQTQREEDILNT